MKKRLAPKQKNFKRDKNCDLAINAIMPMMMKQHCFLFLSTYKGEAKRITGKSVEKLVAKYSSSFKHEMSPHDFRHSLASALYKNTNSIITASQQLGHSANSNVTNLYLHVGNDESTDAINSI